MTDSVARLKELLFDRETATLGEFARRLDTSTAATTASLEELNRLQAATRALHDDLARRIAHLDARAGTPEALRTSVAAVLDDVIVEARETKQENVSRALAPMLVKTIKAELKNNQAEMVEALYPITGQLVKAYVASAMKDLTNRMNRRLQSNAFMLRVRSLFSGYSRAELLLAESQSLEVEELYLVRRGSGELLQRWPANTFRANSDIHMSSMMAAINDFAADALQGDDGGQLRSFNFDDATIYLRASPVYLLAAKCRGIAVPGVDSLLDNEFLATVKRQHEAAATSTSAELPAVHSDVLSDLKTRLEAGIADRHEVLSRAGMPFSPARALAAVALFALIAGIGWYGWLVFEQEATRTKARAVIADVTPLKGYPVILDVESGGRSLSIAGVAPSNETRTVLMRRLADALPGVIIEDRGFAAMPPPARDVGPEIEAVRREVSTLESQTARTSILTATTRSLDRAEKRLADALPDLAALTSRVPGPLRKTLTAIEEDTRRTLTEIRARLAIVRRALPDGDERTATAAALNKSASQLRSASLVVAGTSSRPAQAGTAQPSSAPARTSTDLTEAAEEVSLAAERIATTAASALQTASLLPTALDRFRAYARTQAIFFANNDDYRDPATATAIVDEVVRLARDTTGLIRVVGYTDERGPQTRNTPLAQSRAEKVLEALVAKGLPRARLVAVGRSTGPDLSPQTGPDSANRRVEFEAGYEHEPMAAGR